MPRKSINSTPLRERKLKELQTIPSVGKSIALDLWNLGIRQTSDLKGKNPRVLYEKLNTLSGTTQDKCVLYTFRCAVYFASERSHETKKCKWWYWKNKEYNE